MTLKVIPYRAYVLEECKWQWAECQETEGYGPWAAQSETEQREYFKDMYQHLWDARFDLDAVIMPEDEAWQALLVDMLYLMYFKCIKYNIQPAHLRHK